MRRDWKRQAGLLAFAARGRGRMAEGAAFAPVPSCAARKEGGQLGVAGEQQRRELRSRGRAEKIRIRLLPRLDDCPPSLLVLCASREKLPEKAERLPKRAECSGGCFGRCGLIRWRRRKSPSTLSHRSSQLLLPVSVLHALTLPVQLLADRPVTAAMRSRGSSSTLFALSTLALLLPPPAHATYTLQHSYAGSSFFRGWQWFGADDVLTHGAHPLPLPPHFFPTS